MRNLFSKINYLLKSFGLSPGQFFLSLKSLPYFIRNVSKIKKQLAASEDHSFQIASYYPCLGDRFDKAGSIPLHYFHQDLYVAQRILQRSSYKHVDIGSRIDGFVAHMAASREIEVFDIRHITKQISNVHFIQADLMSDNFDLSNYCDSISCLHAIEHFGLGRYGDKVDVDGHIKGLNNITRMLTNGGRFYMSTVIGPQRIEFDAHRVFSVKYLLELFKESFTLERFSYIDDDNSLHISAELSKENISNNFSCYYGCGIFELVKI